MVQVGEVHPSISKLIEITREALFKGISVVKPGVKFSEIGEIIEDFAKSKGYSVCEYFSGHGVGKGIHMVPYVHHVRNDEHRTMEEGMIFTIEPIICMNPNKNVAMWPDGWTVQEDNNASAQWEHTLLVTKEGCEILTLREDESII